MKLNHCSKSAADETSLPLWSFGWEMKSQQENDAVPELNMLDCQVIRIDVPPAHAGITAALRRAFEAAASDTRGRDFDELLRRLN